MEVDVPADKLDKYLQVFMNVLANELVNGMVRRVAVDTGGLKNSIRYEIDGTKIQFFMNEYGLYVEYGTRPHIIVPKNGKALKFKAGGKDVFAKVVNHPGTQAQPFIRPTFHQDFERATQIAARAAGTTL